MAEQMVMEQVVIARAHLDVLLRKNTEYDYLCQALMRRGVTAEDIGVLLLGEMKLDLSSPLTTGTFILPTPQPGIHHDVPEPSRPTQQQHVYGSYYSHPIAPEITRPWTATAHNRDQSSEDLIEFSSSEQSEGGWQTVADKSSTAAGKRSFIFKNLAPGTTCKDIVDVLRGGKILDIHLAAKDGQAYVSFVDPMVAKTFLRWTDLNTIKIRGRIVIIAFAEKTFHTSKHADQRIRQGATRNLLLQGMDADFDEQQIRQDLEHIHNLVVVEVYHPEDGDGIVISLNAIHLASFAKTCMRSRALYKKARISYYPDKCDSITIPDEYSATYKSNPLFLKRMAEKNKTGSWRASGASRNIFDHLAELELED